MAMGGLARVAAAVAIAAFGTVCSSAAGGTYSGGTGTAESPYLIGSAGDVLEMSETPGDWGGHFLMIADVDLAGHVFDRAVIGWDPEPGTGLFEGTPFTGSLNGAGHAISHLTIVAGDGAEYVALAGINVGEIADLRLTDLSIRVGEQAKAIGGVAGANVGSIHSMGIYGSLFGELGCTRMGGVAATNSGDVRDCRVEATLDCFWATEIGGICAVSLSELRRCEFAGEIAGAVLAGGIVGKVYADVIDCRASLLASNLVRSVGGIAGEISSAGSDETSRSIHNCSADLEICSAARTGRGIEKIGGITGWSRKAQITHCEASLVLDAELPCRRVGGVGGLIENGRVEYCWTYVDLKAGDASEYVGGIAGQASSSQFYTSCVFGHVSGLRYLGGIVGDLWGGIVANSYYEGDVTVTREDAVIYSYWDAYAGGLVGRSTESVVAKSWFVGEVSGYYVWRTGAMVGAGACAMSSFFNRELTGFWPPESCDKSYVLSGDQMRTIEPFLDAEWYFSGHLNAKGLAYWRMCKEGVDYPRLAWESAQRGDFACPDGVDLGDLAVLVEAWFCEREDGGEFSRADVNVDGRVDFLDFGVVAEAWMRQGAGGE